MTTVHANAVIGNRNIHGNAVIRSETQSTSATVNNRSISTNASVNHNQQQEASASVHNNTCNTTVIAGDGGTTDHSRLRNLDYEHAGHTGFQRELIPDESITIDEQGHIHANGESYTAGYGIDITDGVISTTLQREHKSYYNTSTYTMYEGVAPYGSLATDAVWTITTIVSNDVGSIVSVNTAINQVWNYN